MRWVSVVLLSCLTTLTGSFGFCKGQDQPATAAEPVMKLVRAHENALALIHQFDIQFELWDNTIATPANASAYLSGTCRWARNGNLERIRDVDFVGKAGLDSDRNKVLFGDLFDDGKERHILKGWDPQHPVTLSPTHQDDVRGYLQPQTRQKMASRDPAPLFLLSFRDVTDIKETRLSLRQLVQRAKAVEVRPGPPPGVAADNGLLCLRIWRDIQNAGEPKSGTYFDVFLDPHAGMMARKLVNHHDNYSWPGEGVIPWAEWAHEVKTFHEAEDGAFFPVASELRVYRFDRPDPTGVTQMKPTAFTVNQPLPVDALDFRFPENMTVQAEVGGERLLYLWGPNNQPVRTLRSEVEVLEAQRDFLKATFFRHRYLVCIILANAVLLVLVVVFWVRFRKRRAKA